MTRIARVIDNNDSQKLGRIKVEILPELQDLPESLLPWACPQQKFDASEGYKASIPAKGSFVLVELDETWTEFSYDGTRPFSNDTTGSQAAYELLGKYKSLTPSYIRYHKTDSYQYTLFEASSELGIVFDDDTFLTWDGSTFKLSCGPKVNMTIDASNGVNINGGNLVIAPKA